MRQFVWVCCLASLVLSGCDREDAASPAKIVAPLQADASPVIEEGGLIQPLPNGRLLQIDRDGLVILDVREQPPAVEGRYREAGIATAYVLGNYAYLSILEESSYRGGRRDVPVPARVPALVAIDIHDYAHPMLVERFELTGAEGSALTVLGTRLVRRGDLGDLYLTSSSAEPSGPPVAGSTRHFVLDSGRIIDALDELPAFGRILWATPDWLVMWHPLAPTDPGNRLSALDISGPQMIQGLDISLDKSFDYAGAVTIEHGQLRIAWSRYSSADTIETFDLSRPTPSKTPGICPVTYQSQVKFQAPDRAFVLGGYGPDRFGTVLTGISSIDFYANGGCIGEMLDAQPPFSVGGIVPLSHDNVLACCGTPESGSNLLIYQVSAPYGVPPIAATPRVGVQGHRGQAYERAVSVEAPDGTVETGLAMLQGFDGTVLSLQLATFSDRTLTARGTVAVASWVDTKISLYDSETVMATNASAVTLFSLRDLDNPQVLNRFNLNPNYGDAFIFGDFSVRTALVDYPISDGDRAEVRPLAETDVYGPPVAGLTMPPYGHWFKVAEAWLVHIVDEERADPAESQTIRSTALQVFDLTHPDTPRQAGRLVIEPPVYGSPQIVGSALVYANPIVDPGSGRVTRYSFDAIDLRDPDQPRLIRELATTTTLPPGGSTLAHLPMLPFETKLYITIAREGSLFAYAVDLADLDHPVIGPATKIPGALIAVSDADLFATASAPSGTSAVWRVSPSGGGRVEAKQIWIGRDVNAARSDSNGHLLVTTNPHRLSGSGPDDVANWTQLDILDETTLAILGHLDIDRHAVLASVADGRTVWQIPGGTLLVDVRDPTTPMPQAYFGGEPFDYDYNYDTHYAIGRGHIILPGRDPTRWNLDLETRNLSNP